tara:strand:+ start:3894 stop:4934 length:1041 start_codon:yes stop_codon:yes gene_type:complete
MIAIKGRSIITAFFILIVSCTKPNTEHLWSVSVEDIIETNGFARDVDIENGIAFIAAGQSGLQVWDLSSRSIINDYYGYTEAGEFLEFDDLAIIGRDSVNKLIFVSESNKDVKIFHYDIGDSLVYRSPPIMSAKTKDFIFYPTILGQFIMFTADNDDGMKWGFFNRDSSNVFGIELISWVIEGGGEIYTPGKPLGIDSDGYGYIVMAVDQMGVELYSIDSLGSEPMLVNRIDTEGNAEKVVLYGDGVYVACDDAGAYYIPKNSFSDDNISLNRFAKDLTVDHISVRENIAALSLGSRGIALYDISDPSSPIERGIFSIGYSYKTKFWGEKLLVCSREGIQILTINF